MATLPQRSGSAFDGAPRRLAVGSARRLKEIPSTTDFEKGEGFAFR